MKYANTQHSGARLNWAVAQALGGGQIDGEVYRLRGVYEELLAAARDKVQEQCAQAQVLRSELDEGGDVRTDVEVDVEDLLALLVALLPGKIKALRRAERALEAYRLRHGLTREPIDPQVLQSLIFLAILMLIEAGINASFFHNAHMVAGPFAALLLSALIAMTNVSVSALAGYFIGRWRKFGANAADADAPEFTARRQRAKWQFLAFVGVMGLFHATVGLVRSLESLDAVQHTLGSYVNLLTTAEALFLVLTGACLSVLAYEKGKRAFADPYPGYGERSRAVVARREELLDLHDELSEQIGERFDEALDDLDRASKQRKRAYVKYNRAVQECLTARRSLERSIRAAETGLRAQIAQLAGHHRAVRGHHPQPAESIPDHLVIFEGFEPGEMPPFQHPPEASPCKARLAQARAQALGRLSGLFQEIFEANQGDSP